MIFVDRIAFVGGVLSLSKEIGKIRHSTVTLLLTTITEVLTDAHIVLLPFKPSPFPTKSGASPGFPDFCQEILGCGGSDSPSAAFASCRRSVMLRSDSVNTPALLLPLCHKLECHRSSRSMTVPGLVHSDTTGCEGA